MTKGETGVRTHVGLGTPQEICMLTRDVGDDEPELRLVHESYFGQNLG